MSSRYRLYLKKKKTLDTKISPDTVVVQNETKNLEEERETDRKVCVCVFGGGGSGSSQGSVNTYLLNNIYYYPGKKDTVFLPDF